MSQATGKQHSKRRLQADALGVAEKSIGGDAKGLLGTLARAVAVGATANEEWVSRGMGVEEVQPALREKGE